MLLPPSASTIMDTTTTTTTLSLRAAALLLLLSTMATPAAAQNGSNATTFAAPPGGNARLRTVNISYAPRPMVVNGTAGGLYRNYTLPRVVRRVAYTVEEGLAIIDGDVVFGTEAELLAAIVDTPPPAGWIPPPPASSSVVVKPSTPPGSYSVRPSTIQSKGQGVTTWTTTARTSTTTSSRSTSTSSRSTTSVSGYVTSAKGPGVSTWSTTSRTTTTTSVTGYPTSAKGPGVSTWSTSSTTSRPPTSAVGPGVYTWSTSSTTSRPPTSAVGPGVYTWSTSSTTSRQPTSAVGPGVYTWSTTSTPATSAVGPGVSTWSTSSRPATSAVGPGVYTSATTSTASVPAVSVYPTGPKPVPRAPEHVVQPRRELTRRSISVTRDDSRKWPGGVIHYYWQDQASKTLREKDFLAAAKIWTDRLPFLKFQDRGISAVTTLNGPIVLYAGTAPVSRSPVGRAASAGGNKMKLGDIGSPPSLGVYVHEIGHTLGLLHEQMRPDWPSYLKLDCSRVCGEYIYKPAPNTLQISHCTDAVCGPADKCVGNGCNFAPRPLSDPEHNWSGPYDEQSIMQLGAYAFSRPESGWLPPIQRADPRLPALRNGTGLVPSVLDAQKVCSIYHESCRGVCGDGVLSPNNGEECDDGNNVDGDGCSASCKVERKTGSNVCGNGKVEAGEECDDGPAGSATCSKACRKIGGGGGKVASKTCAMAQCTPGGKECDPTTTCTKLEGASGDTAKYFCMCAGGFRASGGEDAGKDPRQMRVPWPGREGAVFVAPGTSCNVLCGRWTLGRDSCDSVAVQEGCY